MFSFVIEDGTTELAGNIRNHSNDHGDVDHSTGIRYLL